MTTEREALRSPVQGFGGKGNLVGRLLPLIPRGGRPYDHEVYRPLVEAGWEKITIVTSCYAVARTRVSGRRGRGSVTARDPRTECVWRNPRAREAAPHD